MDPTTAGLGYGMEYGYSVMERLRIAATAGLGYGMEYGYSVMERLRIAALQGDKMTQLPMLVTPGYEAWRHLWETLTATALIESGADIVVMRHPEAVKRVKAFIERLMK